MSKSAVTRLERRRIDTAHRITVCAQQLTETQGFDGFTMDDLALRADVSRRTLFNYFPSKLDATLGAVPALEDEPRGVFRDRGPSGDLLTDLGVLAGHLLEGKEFTREEAALSQRVLMAEPRLIAAAHDRFEKLLAEFTEEIHLREGRSFDPQRASVALRVLGCLFDVALEQYLSVDDETPLIDHFHRAVDTARTLFA